GCCAPVLMKLEAACTSYDLLNESSCRARVTFTEKAKVDWKTIGCLQHLLNVPRTWRASGCIRPYRRPCPAAQHCRQARIKSFFDLLGADVMNVGVDSTGGDNLAFARDHLSSGADHYRDVRLNVGIPRFSDRGNPTVFDCDICLHDSPVIENQS